MFKNDKTKLSLDFGGPVLLLLFFGAIGYFVYGGVKGFFGVLLIGIILTLLLVLSLIPYGGGIVYLCINLWLVIPLLLSFTGLWWTLLITIMLIPFSIFSIMVSIFVGMIITANVMDW